MMNDILEKYLELKKQEAEVTKQLNSLKNEIKLAYAIGDSETNGIKVSRSLRIRIDLDKEAVLLKIGADAYKECEKATEYEVLTVKRL
jgi:hypothetical protein